MNKIVLCLFISVTSTLANRCSKDDTLFAVKKPIYDFSVRFLERVTEQTEGNFVYSPLATWLQLVTIAEGAHGRTLEEIWNVTGLKGYRKKTCYRRKFREILNDFEDNVANDFKRKSVVVVDKFYKVKENFKRKVEKLHNVKVLSLDFDHPNKTTDDVDAILQEVNQEVNDVESESVLPYVYADDFDRRVVLMYDAANLKANWKYAFNPAQTRLAPFYYDSTIAAGSVFMMNQIGKFKETEMPLINAKVLELPCADERLSMLIYLPLQGIITDLYYLLKDISLSGVLNKLEMEEPKWMNVSLPAFELDTEIPNVIELLYDMGVKRAFYPDTAELKYLTDSPISVSYMYQRATIQVNEFQITAAVENLVADAAVEFNANKPFAFMLVDKKTELMLFAGMYSEPDQKEIIENDTIENDILHNFNSKSSDVPTNAEWDENNILPANHVNTKSNNGLTDDNTKSKNDVNYYDDNLDLN